MKKRIKIFINGHVHGVFFRSNIQKIAKKLGITGYACNVHSGVEVIAEGEEENLKKLHEYCRRGPEEARVEKTDSNWSAPENKFNDFEIR